MPEFFKPSLIREAIIDETPFIGTLFAIAVDKVLNDFSLNMKGKIEIAQLFPFFL